MKTITLLLLSAMAGMTANAAMVNDTVVDLKDVHRVIITENDSTSSMEIKGMGADSAYHYTYQRRTGSETLLDEHSVDVFYRRTRCERSSEVRDVTEGIGHLKYVRPWL